jgi:hypothetical protein
VRRITAIVTSKMETLNPQTLVPAQSADITPMSTTLLH